MARNETYKEFVEKFEPKKTTDDCYTPPKIYEVVKDWVVNEYGLQNYKIIRPFNPNDNYKAYDYTGNCVVIDNPPFSILAEIKKYYCENNIKFFLFAPHLTLFSTSSIPNNYIVTDSLITYENGAKVITSFVTNMGEVYIRSAPVLKRQLKEADRKTTKALAKHEYPKEIISSALLGKITNCEFEINRKDCHSIRRLDAQKATKKALFGGGFLVSELKALELKALKLKALELKALELKALELKALEEIAVWELSENEKHIISTLG